MWITIVSWLEKIPATFWGVVAGSLFTLLGIWLQNRGHDRRLVRQLAHDREVKARERDLALRKEIYLDAAEAVQAAFNSLMSFPNLDIPNDKVMAAYTEKNAAIAKVYVVAKIETARAFANLLTEFTDAGMRLMIARAPLFGRKTYAKALEGYIQGWEKEAGRWLEEIKQFNVAGLVDQRRWSVLNSNLEAAQKAAKGLRQEQEKANEEVMRGSLSLFEAAISESARIQKLVGPLVLAVRRELETADDEKAYGEILEGAAAKAAASTRQFVADITKLVAQAGN